MGIHSTTAQGVQLFQSRLKTNLLSPNVGLELAIYMLFQSGRSHLRGNGTDFCTSKDLPATLIKTSKSRVGGASNFIGPLKMTVQGASRVT